MTSRRVEDVRLDHESEDALWRAWRNEDCLQAREALVEAYMPFTRILCAKLFAMRVHNECDFEDYFQYASIGLLEAMERFDPSRGVQFRTYAAHRIQGAVLNGLEHLSERQQQIVTRRALLSDRVGHSKLALEEIDANSGPELLHTLAEIGIGLAIGFMLEESVMYISGERGVIENGYARTELRQLRERISSLVKQLPAREGKLIALHYLQGVPFEEIAGDWGLSKGRISQLHRQALDHLRNLLSTDLFCDLAIY